MNKLIKINESTHARLSKIKGLNGWKSFDFMFNEFIDVYKEYLLNNHDCKLSRDSGCACGDWQDI